MIDQIIQFVKKTNDWMHDLQEWVTQSLLRGMILFTAKSQQCERNVDKTFRWWVTQSWCLRNWCVTLFSSSKLSVSFSTSWSSWLNPYPLMPSNSDVRFNILVGYLPKLRRLLKNPQVRVTRTWRDFLSTTTIGCHMLCFPTGRRLDKSHVPWRILVNFLMSWGQF